MTCVVHHLPIYTTCYSATDMDMKWRIQSCVCGIMGPLAI